LGAKFDSCWPNAYKHGDWACLLEDIDLVRIAERLRQEPRRPIDELVATELAREIEEAIVLYEGDRPDPPLAKALARGFNTLIHKESIWEQGVDGIELRDETDHLHSQNPQGENLEKLNRMLLEDAYPGGLRQQRRVEDPLLLKRGRASGD
jgi:hypothetical protein